MRSAMQMANQGESPRNRHRSGFTLIECLVALFLIALVLPAVNLSFAAITRSAALARQRTEAAGLAQSQLSNLIASGNWQGSAAMNGDFGPDWKQYTWTAAVSNWTGGTTNSNVGTNTVTMEQLDVTVSWGTTSAPNTVTVSSLVYQRPTSSD